MEQFQHALQMLKKGKEYVLPGTTMRYIISSITSPGTIDILLVWGKDSSLNEVTRKQAMKEFQRALADIVDWHTW
jgi:hypothetical protein